MLRRGTAASRICLALIALAIALLLAPHLNDHITDAYFRQ